ncbi:MAG: hypothetical protein ABFC78_00550 [Methanoregula sp.]
MEINGITLPAFGTLAEVHAVLIDSQGLNALDDSCVINGYGYTITKNGFLSVESEKERTPDTLTQFHTGIAIVIGYNTQEWEGLLPALEIITTGRLPHISKRCTLCGMQLDKEGIKRGACTSCHAMEVGH